MRVSPNLESVERSLLRRGAPAGYVGRLVRELAEHREDLVDDLMRVGATLESAEREADQRLGDVAAVAEVAFAKLRQASFVGRHRVVFLIILPVVCLSLSWVAALVIAAWLAGMLSASFQVGTMSAQAYSLLWVACWLCGYVTPAAIALVFWLLARRRFCGRVWSWTPCLALCLVSSFLFVRTFMGGNGGTSGRLVIGAAAMPDLLKALTPLSVVCVLEVNWMLRVRCNGRLDTSGERESREKMELIAKGR